MFVFYILLCRVLGGGVGVARHHLQVQSKESEGGNVRGLVEWLVTFRDYSKLLFSIKNLLYLCFLCMDNLQSLSIV